MLKTMMKSSNVVTVGVAYRFSAENSWAGCPNIIAVPREYFVYAREMGLFNP